MLVLVKKLGLSYLSPGILYSKYNILHAIRFVKGSLRTRVVIYQAGSSLSWSGGVNCGTANSDRNQFDSKVSSTRSLSSMRLFYCDQ